MTCVSQSEFARMCGVSRQAVMKWKLAGRLVLQGNLVDGRAYAEVPRRWLAVAAPGC